MFLIEKKPRRKKTDGVAVCHENGYQEGSYRSNLNTLIWPRQDKHVEEKTGTSFYNCTYCHFY